MDPFGERIGITEVKANKMTTEEIIEALELKVFTVGNMSSEKVTGGYVSDLLSDVMGHAKEGEIWITLQSHLNVVAISSLKELAAILLVKGIVPDKAVIERAGKEGVSLLGTVEDTYTITGKLYQLLGKE